MRYYFKICKLANRGSFAMYDGGLSGSIMSNIGDFEVGARFEKKNENSFGIDLSFKEKKINWT